MAAEAEEEGVVGRRGKKREAGKGEGGGGGAGGGRATWEARRMSPSDMGAADWVEPLRGGGGARRQEGDAVESFGASSSLFVRGVFFWEVNLSVVPMLLIRFLSCFVSLLSASFWIDPIFLIGTLCLGLPSGRKFVNFACESYGFYTNILHLGHRRIRGAMVARLTPDQKVACSIHVGFKFPVNGFLFSSLCLFFPTISKIKL
jgi:hypothetical protein